MDFGIKKGQLEVSFTQGEMAALTDASGDVVAFSGTVDEIIDASRPSGDCCRPALYCRLPYEVLHAVWRSPQVESSTLSAKEAHFLGSTIGLAMFGTQAINKQTPSKEAVAQGSCQLR